MIRFTSYSSNDSLIHRNSNNFHGYLPQKRIVKYVTSNECESILVLNNVAIQPHLLKYLYTKLRLNLCNERRMSNQRSTSEKPKLKKFCTTTAVRKEYYNDIDACLQIPREWGNNSIYETIRDGTSCYSYYVDEMDSIISPKSTEITHLSSNPVDLLSSNDSTAFLDAIEGDYDMKNIHDSDDDTMKSITRTSTSKASLDDISASQLEVLVVENSATNYSSNMTVMATDNQDVLSGNDWGEERNVVITRDENHSYGISIVGGTVNVSDDAVVSGIFIKNIIRNSPADKCGLLKVGDRILSVDGTNIRHSSHDHALKSIKNADSKIVLRVQSLIKKIDDNIEASALLKKIPPPITPCKTPDPLVIQEGNGKVVDGHDGLECPDKYMTTKSTEQSVNPDTPIHKRSDSGPEEESSDDEDARDLEGKIYTKAGIEIDRASAGNIRRTKEETSLDTEEEDCYGYTAKKIKKRYTALGHVFHHSLDRDCGSTLGISLAGHRDRTKMACFIAGINPKGAAANAPFEIGDEILEINGLVLHGRSHLNVPTIIKSLEGSTLKIVILRRKNASEELAVKPVTQFPVCINEEDEIFSTYKNVRIVSIKKAASGLGIMIIEGKHAEAGQGIFISDIQEGSMADKGAVIIDILPNSIAAKDRRLQIFDQILEINGTKVLPHLSESQIQKAVKQLQPRVRLVVFRPSVAETETVEVEVIKKPGKILGVGFRANHPHGVIIIDMLPGSLAESDRRMIKGDIITSLNSEKISNMSYDDCSLLFKTSQGKIEFSILRPKPKNRVL
ncbi:inactivation-no-after-potential D protein isoform X4 [Aedes albopictus]|uniref:PDZ domain-containing protein n=1 Tax=Aedes albopictus TaxID=7160 RepID=A0ABM1Z136_AEDAL